MEKKYYLAVDIGASSGRHMLFSVADGKIEMEEIYRFENGMVSKDGHLYWDTDRLFKEIVQGLKECKGQNKIPVSMAIDTWAVDYVLLDGDGQRVGDVYGYRDIRTEGMDEVVSRVISEKDLYFRNGIQKQIFNTIYQLTADKEQRPEVLEKAETFLMLPDYFGYRLTGQMASEYTNATTTALVSPETKQWDKDLIEKLGIPTKIFRPLETPGKVLGKLTPEIEQEVGFNCDFILCATHDTGSCVAAMPDPTGTGLYISSGTWSLMGTELPTALKDATSQAENYTNEGGVDYRFRYLKNIMGLWMIQCVRHELGDKYSFAELAEMARQNGGFESTVDVNDESFLAPASMTEAIREYCRKKGEAVPETPGELAVVIFRSLAKSYAVTAHEIEENTGRKFDRIMIIGGGSKNTYLDELTASLSRHKVYAGPSEATATGNALVQMIVDGVYKDISEARKAVKDSFDVSVY